MGGGESASPGGGGRQAFVPPGGFRSQGSLDYHFGRHANELGADTAGAYEQLARQHLNRPADGVNVLEFYRSDGDRLVYDVQNNWFGIVTNDGTIRTFFSPEAGMRYWDNVIAREQS